LELERLWFALKPDVWRQLTSILCLLVILVPSAIGDYQRQKIPNWLSMSGWIIAPALAGLCTGSDGVEDSLLGLGLMVVLLFPLWMLHWFGAADVKLIGTVGAFVGVSDSLSVLLGIFVTGLLMSIVVLLYKRRLLLTLNALTILLSSRWGGRVSNIPLGGVDNEEPIILPYAIPIAFGTMLTILILLLQ
jgi:prepilin peptidase CpaA